MANVLGSLLVELGVNMAAFHDGMNKATYTAKQTSLNIANSFKTMGATLDTVLSQFGSMGQVIGETLGSAGSTMGAIASKMGSMGGAAGYAAIGVGGLAAAGLAASATLHSLARDGAELVHSLEMMSAKTGMSIRDLQTLQAAGSMVGMSLDAMAIGFRRFDQAIANTGRGGGQAQVVLKSLGVTATDQKEALYQVADAFQKMADGPRKAADAIALFGRAGLMMIPLLNQGRKGFEEAATMVDRYGAKIGDDAVRADEAYMVSQAKMTLAWDAFKIDIESKVLPSITKYTTMMAEALRSTRGLGDEITGHFGESIKAFAAGFANANASSGFLTKSMGPLGSLIAGIGGGIGGVSSAAESHGPTEAEKQANARAEATKIASAAEASHLKVIKDIFDAEKEGGPQEAKLAQTKESIAEALADGTSASMAYALSLQVQLPLLEKAAKDEKELNDLRLNPVRLTPAKNEAADMLRTLDLQLTKHQALATQLNATAAATTMMTAAEDAKNSVLNKQNVLQEELQMKQAELRADTGSASQNEMLRQRIAQIKELQAALDKATPDIIAKQQAIAVGGVVTGAGSSLAKALEKKQAELADLRTANIANANGGAGAENYSVAKAVETETIAVQEAQAAYDAYISRYGAISAAMSPFKTGLDEANKKLAQETALQHELIAAELDASLIKQTNALHAEAAGWDLVTAATFKSAAAQREANAAAAAEKYKQENPSANTSQITQAYKNALEQQQHIFDETVATAAAQSDLNKKYDDEMTKLSAVRDLLVANGRNTLLIDAQIKDAQEKMNAEWDQAALKAGTFQQRVAAVLNTVQQQGTTLAVTIGDAFIKAADDWQSAMSKLIVTGKISKGTFTQIGQQMAESVTSGLLKQGMGKISGSLLNMTGLNKLLPGLGPKADGSSSNPFFVQLVNSGLAAGASGGDAAGLMANLPFGKLFSNMGQPTAPMSFMTGMGHGIGGLFSSLLGLIPGLAAGGDVTPGKAYIVGEKRPELFVPGTSGRIVPNFAGTPANSQTTVSMHIHGVTDVDSFKKSATQVTGMMGSAVQRAQQRQGRQ